MNSLCHHHLGRTKLTVALSLLLISHSALAETTVHHFNKLDPYEQVNRKMYAFNDKLDDYVGKPVSDAYKWITPQFVQTRIFNFFNNLKEINIVLNDVMQAKFEQGLQDTGRFAINSTAGLAGLFDVAQSIGWQQNDEDFEQTLAFWGVKSGAYLVLPVLGPTTLRGIPGRVFDTAANPSTYIGVITDVTVPIQLVSLLNTRASADGSLKFVNEAALDPYVFTRDSFLQWRNNLIKDGNVSAEIEEFDEESNAVAGSPVAKFNVKGFNDAAHSFDNTKHSFAQTTQAFEQAAQHLEKRFQARSKK